MPSISLWYKHPGADLGFAKGGFFIPSRAQRANFRKPRPLLYAAGAPVRVWFAKSLRDDRTSGQVKSYRSFMDYKVYGTCYKLIVFSTLLLERASLAGQTFFRAKVWPVGLRKGMKGVRSNPTNFTWIRH